MNLWVKRIGQLAVLPVALFFFSCEDEVGVLGYKNPNPKFQASYVEIPIESSVLLLDSQRTSNFAFSGETNRLLLGKYVDDQFGTISSDVYSQFFTNTSAKLPASVTYDSVSLHLLLDFYHYGSTVASTPQSISVYELDGDLQYENRRNYFNRSEVQTKPAALGSKTFSRNIEELDKVAKDNPDSTIFITIPLNSEFGQRLFNSALQYRDAATKADSTQFLSFSEFTKNFKGIAVKTDDGDKILGISTNSSISVYYHAPADTVSTRLNFGLSLVTNFSQIKADRSGTELGSLTEFASDFYPANSMRYVQSGTGVYTKLDFGKFFEFCDTVPNVVITSAEVSITQLENSSFKPSTNYILRLLKDNNFLERYSKGNVQDSIDLIMYNPRFRRHTGTLAVDLGQSLVNEGDSTFYALGDANPYLAYSETKQSLSGNFALFFQQLSLVAEQKRRFQYFLLTPSTPVPNNKSVNRAVFPKDNIKLKIYYTKPTTPVN